MGTLLAGALPGVIGVQPTLLVATVGACLGFLWLLPSPIPRLRTVRDFLPTGETTATGHAT